MQSSFSPVIGAELRRFSSFELASTSRAVSTSRTRDSERQALLSDSFRATPAINMSGSTSSANSERYQAIRRAEQQVDEIRDILVRNIDQLEQRGEKLELLIDKTRVLEVSVNSVHYLLDFSREKKLRQL